MSKEGGSPSRHWRLNAQRYRLEGFRNPNGKVSLQGGHYYEKEEENDSEDNSLLVLNKTVNDADFEDEKSEKEVA